MINININMGGTSGEKKWKGEASEDSKKTKNKKTKKQKNKQKTKNKKQALITLRPKPGAKSSCHQLLHQIVLASPPTSSTPTSYESER